MSRAKAMPLDRRVEGYYRQNGARRLTPAQRRRAKQKANRVIGR